MNDLDALWGFLTALVVALLATPLVMRLARRVGAVVQPHERGLHDESTPGLGGVALLAAVLVAGVVFLPWNGETRAILAGAAVIVVVGAVDDAVELPAGLKLLGQTAAALIPVLAGVYVDNLTLPFIHRVDLGEWGIPATLAGVVAVMKVVNPPHGGGGAGAGVGTIATPPLAGGP